MNSMIVHVYVIVLAVLVVHESLCCYDSTHTRQHAALRPPFNFSYYCHEKDIKLKVMVILQNLSPDVIYTMYKTRTGTRIYGTGEKQQQTKSKKDKKEQIEEIRNCRGEKQLNIEHEIKEQDNAIRIYLVLKKKGTRATCRKTITILEGKALSTNTQVPDLGYNHNDTCLRRRPCTILVDLANECIGSSTKTSETQAATTTAGDTSSPFNTESVKPLAIPGSVPNPNYFNKNATTSDSDVTTTPYTYIETSTTWMTRNDDKKTDKQSQSFQDVLQYVIPSVILVVLCVIILVMYIYVKKYRHRNSDQVDTIELNTYATANDVVYADLNLAHGGSQPPRRDEDSTYAQIIAVIRPDHGNVINN